VWLSSRDGFDMPRMIAGAGGSTACVSTGAVSPRSARLRTGAPQGAYRPREEAGGHRGTGKRATRRSGLSPGRGPPATEATLGGSRETRITHPRERAEASDERSRNIVA